MDLMSYTNAKAKTALITTSTDANGSGRVQRIAGMYDTLSAISDLLITCGSNMAIGTTATLYGILKA
jgi:flagellar motor component MotA